MDVPSVVVMSPNVVACHICWALLGPFRYCRNVALEPRGTAQIRVCGSEGANRFEPCFYGAEDSLVPQRWAGVTNAAGELSQTDVLNGVGHVPSDVLLWLGPTAGAEAEEELVRGAVQVAVGSRSRKRAAAGG